MVKMMPFRPLEMSQQDSESLGQSFTAYPEGIVVLRVAGNGFEAV
jgi:hypothetical protein